MRVSLLIVSGVAALGLATSLALAQNYNPPAGGAAPAGDPPAAGAPGPAAQAPAAGAAAGEEDMTATALIAAMQGTQHTLAAGIAQVVTGDEVPIEAKFEVEDGVFFLSVYTSEKGLGTIAEENVFKEYKGDAAGVAWAPEVEVFEDFQHIARSAQYHTLLSMTDITILDIIETASANGDVVISVKAKVVDGRAVFEVMTLAGGAVRTTLYDLMTGLAAG